MNAKQDILSQIANRKPEAKKTKMVMMWCVVLDDGRRSRHLFTAKKAVRIARRYNKMFGSDAAYANRFGKVWV